jgi:hypothetical protein
MKENQSRAEIAFRRQRLDHHEKNEEIFGSIHNRRSPCDTQQPSEKQCQTKTQKGEKKRQETKSSSVNCVDLHYSICVDSFRIKRCYVLWDFFICATKLRGNLFWNLNNSRQMLLRSANFISNCFSLTSKRRTQVLIVFLNSRIKST